MPPLEHTPYVGSRKPFTIGLSKLDVADWIELDDRLERDLALKDHIFTEAGSGAFREEPASREAQAEALGVERSNLYRKMRAFGINPPRKSEDEDSA